MKALPVLPKVTRNVARAAECMWFTLRVYSDVVSWVITSLVVATGDGKGHVTTKEVDSKEEAVCDSAFPRMRVGESGSQLWRRGSGQRAEVQGKETYCLASRPSTSASRR